MKNRVTFVLLTLILTFVGAFSGSGIKSEKAVEETEVSAVAESSDYIKYIDFTPTYAAMKDCMFYDIDNYGTNNHYSWIELLSAIAAENYGSFDKYSKKQLDNLVAKAKKTDGMENVVTNKKLYSYYLKAYGAVLGGMVGKYTELTVDKSGNTSKKIAYGLRVFSPIAEGYSFVDYDDFGASRSYGYRRSHLGHDLLGNIGTPIICTESGYIEHLGWNNYGGWRIGIRSLDGQRYYYYAHLRKGHPYTTDLYEGKYVNAGEVIGYLGMTGYSRKEDVNGIDKPHLHFGLQIIFDKKQIDGYNQIWCDMYELTRLLMLNRAKTYINEPGNDRASEKVFIYPEMPD